MSNGTSPFPPGDAGPGQLATLSLPPFPTWPPPSGGAPVTTPELGPILNPYPYGSTQGPNISTSPPSPPPGYPPPWGPLKGTAYPQKMPSGANGQNQGPGYGLPTTTKPWEVGPLKANPAISAISPAPIMGPGPQGVQPWEAGPLAGSPAPAKTFPAGSYIDGYGNVITPTYVITLGTT